MERLDAIRDLDLPLYRCFESSLDLRDYPDIGRLLSVHDWFRSYCLLLPKSGLFPSPLRIGPCTTKLIELPAALYHANRLFVLLLRTSYFLLVHGNIPNHENPPFMELFAPLPVKQDPDLCHYRHSFS